MYTASEIAKQIGMETYTVRYRLAKLREEKKIQYEKFGNIYAYPIEAFKYVLNFEKRPA